MCLPWKTDYLQKFIAPGGTLIQLPDLQTLTPFRTFTITNLDIPGRPCEQGFPGVGIDVIENFAIRFRGFLNIETAGTYNFALSSDDGSRLHINGNRIIDHDGLATRARGNPGRGSVVLTAGLHDVEVQYFQGPLFAYRVTMVLATSGWHGGDCTCRCALSS